MCIRDSRLGSSLRRGRIRSSRRDGIVRGLRRALLRRCGLRSSALRTCSPVADHRDHGVNLHGRTLGDLDLLECARRRRGNLRIHFVGRDLKQRLVAVDFVANLLQPLGQRSLGDRFAHLGHYYIRRHRSPSPSHGRKWRTVRCARAAAHSPLDYRALPWRAALATGWPRDYRGHRNARAVQ
jgi:hypothetical protein